MHFSDLHSQRDKHLLRLERELDRLRHAQWHAPIVPLERPYQRGWIKTFTLRADAQQHPDHQVFRAVLPVINHRLQSRDGTFLQPDGRPMVLRPEIIRVGHWLRLGWPASHQRLFAYGQWLRDDIYPWTEARYRRAVPGFKLVRCWWLEETIRPLMLTHCRVDLPLVRSRIAEIEAALDAVQGRRRLGWLHGHRQRWRGGRWFGSRRVTMPSRAAQS